ncbi:hypothetical protein Patl1_29662 [Pistacia atlantica]|uniref:Uncharacterized protein n=1 Tax=Pistacia atlantica TaxID=434234 RepID=A0ACC1AFH1_9ROSI|nr:hypothetical protein Patl1_29662 [Pistacia atlantica]
MNSIATGESVVYFYYQSQVSCCMQYSYWKL